MTGSTNVPTGQPIGSGRVPASPLVGRPFWTDSWQEAHDRSASEGRPSPDVVRQVHALSHPPPVPAHALRDEQTTRGRAGRLRAGEVELVESFLSHRDRAVLASFLVVPILSGGQIERLHFRAVEEPSRARRRRQVLTRLVGLRVIERLPRRVGGAHAGSAGYLYVLGLVGERLLGEEGRRRRWRGGVALIPHTLLVSEVFVRAKEAEAGGWIEGLSFVTEPASWQEIDDGEERWTLKPDAFLQYRRQTPTGPKREEWFVEVDRGTESPSTVRKKVERYEAAWESGFAVDGAMPRVWWFP